MSAQSVADAQRTLQVHAVAGRQLAEIGPAQGFRAGLEVTGLTFALDDGQAGAVESHTIADRQLGGNGWGGDDEPPAGAFGRRGADRSERFDKAREHA